MNIYYREKNLYLEDLEDFNIQDVLECGQCFHFSKMDELEYELVAFGKYLHVKQEQNKLCCFNTTQEEYDHIWRDYFDIERDYALIKKRIISADERLNDAVTVKQGIRILNQDFFETLISFIMSQNKQIPHIKQIVHTISERYGTKIDCGNGKTAYAFPTVEQLQNVTEEQLRECKTGFRAPYIKNAVDKVAAGEIDSKELRDMDAKTAREKLMTIKGVGEKVANCVLLFGLGKRDAFPVDVWMKRIMETMYFDKDTKKEVIEQFAVEKFGEYAGYAQQYLFCYGRENGIGK